MDSSQNYYTQLIKNLSLPVNRLDKYTSLLKEYFHRLEVKFLIFIYEDIYSIVEGITYGSRCCTVSS